MAGEVSLGFYVPTHSTFVLVYPRDSSSMHTNKILCNTYHNGKKFFLEKNSYFSENFHYGHLYITRNQDLQSWF